MKYWEIIADNLHNAGWSLGWVSAMDSQGRTIWIVDAHRDEKRFIIRADELLTAYVKIESAVFALEASNLHSHFGSSTFVDRYPTLKLGDA